MMQQKIFFEEIIAIQSLNRHETQTGLELADKINRKVELLKIEDIRAKLINVSSKKELVDVLKNLKYKLGKRKTIPCIHFEMHGFTEGLALRNNDRIQWADLQPLLLDLNASTNNNLFVSLATCYGQHIFNSISLLKRIPFFGFVGSLEVVYVRKIRIGKPTLIHF